MTDKNIIITDAKGLSPSISKLKESCYIADEFHLVQSSDTINFYHLFSRYFAEETFYFGDLSVTIQNPISHFRFITKKPDIQKSLVHCTENYESTFRELAEASRIHYLLVKDFSIQKQQVIEYIENNPTAEVSASVNVSTTTIRDLKNGKREIETINLGLFERLYKKAVEAEINKQQEKGQSNEDKS